MSKLSTLSPSDKQALRGNKTPQEEFQYRWQQIEKAKKLLVKKQQEQLTLVEAFNCELLPFEQEICRLQFHFLERLVGFTDKKSLSENQIVELFDWIEEVYDSLQSSPFRIGLDLEGVMASARNKQLESLAQDSDALQALREQINLDIGFDAKLTDEDLLAIFTDPEVLLKKINQAVMADKVVEGDQDRGDAENNEIFDDFESFFNHTFGHEVEFLDGVKNELFLSKGVLNRCYKKLANRFHPDKVKPEDKEESHALMVELSKAKKANDAFTIFMLYQTHIHDDDVVFADEELQHLNFLLSIKLNELQSEIDGLRYGNEMDAIICRKFKGRSKRATQINFARHLDELKDIIEIYHGYSELKTVKILKEHLAERRNRVMFYW